MISPDGELVCVVYALYLFDCIHWIRIGEVAATRGFWTGWKFWKMDDLSFTLLGRMPVLVNPIDFRPGFVRLGSALAQDCETFVNMSDQDSDHIRGFSHSLTLCCGCGGVLFLVALPLIVQSGWLSFLWKPLLLMIGIMHTAIVAEFVRNSSEWRIIEPRTFWRTLVAVSLNPISALRAGDVLSENIPRLRTLKELREKMEL